MDYYKSKGDCKCQDSYVKCVSRSLMQPVVTPNGVQFVELGGPKNAPSNMNFTRKSPVLTVKNQWSGGRNCASRAIIKVVSEECPAWIVLGGAVVAPEIPTDIGIFVEVENMVPSTVLS